MAGPCWSPTVGTLYAYLTLPAILSLVKETTFQFWNDQLCHRLRPEIFIGTPYDQLEHLGFHEILLAPSSRQRSLTRREHVAEHGGALVGLTQYLGCKKFLGLIGKVSDKLFQVLDVH